MFDCLVLKFRFFQITITLFCECTKYFLCCQSFLMPLVLNLSLKNLLKILNVLIRTKSTWKYVIAEVQMLLLGW